VRRRPAAQRSGTSEVKALWQQIAGFTDEISR